MDDEIETTKTEESESSIVADVVTGGLILIGIIVVTPYIVNAGLWFGANLANFIYHRFAEKQYDWTYIENGKPKTVRLTHTEAKELGLVP